MQEIEKPGTDLPALAEQLRVLAEPRRLQILHMLMEGVQCNCELGEALDMPPNLISHHMRVLRGAGLVDMERDPDDARWVYYSIDRRALQALNQAFDMFFDPRRVKPRRRTCGPQAASVQLLDISLAGR
jgi:ArsR family transcriptional regulator